MKIAFWSNAYEQSNVSSNLTAVSIASVFRFPYTITVVENHLSKNNLGWAYLGTNRAAFLREVGTNYYEGGGMEGLLRRIYRGDRNPDILKPYLKGIINKHLYYIPQTGIIHSELFDYEFNYNAASLFNLLEEHTDLCYIDTAPFNNLSSMTILEEADLIVVNLCQNHIYLEDFFLNYPSLISKAVFIIGNYSNQTFLSIRRISKLYGLPLETIVSIPSNELFLNACSRGRAVEFITGNYMCSKENPNYLFIQSVKKAAGMIIRKAEQSDGLIRREISHCGR